MSSAEYDTASPAAPAGDQPDVAAAASPVPTVALLDDLRSLPLAEHPERYQRIHSELRTALAEIDNA